MSGERRLEHLSASSPRDLEQQQRLTRRLLAACPVYDTVTRGWSETISAELETPVVLESHGPTSADKRHHALRALVEAASPSGA